MPLRVLQRCAPSLAKCTVELAAATAAARDVGTPYDRSRHDAFEPRRAYSLRAPEIDVLLGDPKTVERYLAMDLQVGFTGWRR